MTENFSRQTRNLASALYIHSGQPNEEVNIHSILITAEKCVNGINDFLNWLEKNPNANEVEIQTEAYECGKRYLNKNEIKTFFSSIYLLFLANPDGPRLGMAVKLTGIELFVKRIRTRLNDPFGWIKNDF